MTDFKTNEAFESPYMRAKQEYDDLIGSAITRAANWRYAFLFAMSGLCLCIFGLIYQSQKASVIPYIVEITDKGYVRLVGKADTANYKPTLAGVNYFLSQFISNIRSIPKDTVLLKKSFLNAYSFVTQKGKTTLNAYAQERNPFELAKNQIISVEINSINRQSEKSYQVQWQEQSFFPNGQPLQKINYIGIFNIELQTPKTEQALKINPLGIFIDFFSISKQLGA